MIATGKVAFRAALAALVLAGALAGSGGAARADLMTACAADIARYCADVRTGRGRVSACLAARGGGLSAACQPEVSAVINGRLTPADMRAALAPGSRVALPEACRPAAARLCQGVGPGDGRIFACLYARGDRVDATCRAQARAAMQAE